MRGMKYTTAHHRIIRRKVVRLKMLIPPPLHNGSDSDTSPLPILEHDSFGQIFPCLSWELLASCESLASWWTDHTVAQDRFGWCCSLDWIPSDGLGQWVQVKKWVVYLITILTKPFVIVAIFIHVEVAQCRMNQFQIVFVKFVFHSERGDSRLKAGG